MLKVPNPLFLRILIAILALFDMIGFLLFLVSLSAIGAPLAMVASMILDIAAALTFFVFAFIQITLVDMRFLYGSIDKLKSLVNIVKRKSSLAFRNQGGKASGKFDNIVGQLQEKIRLFLARSIVWRMVLLLISSIIEFVPLLGDFSPTWILTTIFVMRQRHRLLKIFVDLANGSISTLEARTQALQKVKTPQKMGGQYGNIKRSQKSQAPSSARLAPKAA